MISAKLAIAIPTYERADLLSLHLSRMLPAARQLGVEIYISDDSRSDSTQELIEPMLIGNVNLHYQRNRPPLLHDNNLLASLLRPESEYVWLLGDGLCIEPDALERVFGFLDGQDLVFVNSHADAGTDVHAAFGDKARALVRDLLWHQTLTGATIYSRRVLDWFSASHLRGTALVVKNFPQLSVVLGYLDHNGGSVGWFADHSITSAPRPSYWRDNAINVFVYDWARLVSSFPRAINPSEVTATIRSHSHEQGLFSRRMLLYQKALGNLRLSLLWNTHFRSAMHLPFWQVAALIVFPHSLLRLGICVCRYIERGGRRFKQRRP